MSLLIVKFFTYGGAPQVKICFKQEFLTFENEKQANTPCAYLPALIKNELSKIMI